MRERTEMMTTKQLDPKSLLELAERMEPKPVAPTRPGRPKLVCDHGQVVAEAVVIVSEFDWNWWRTDAWRTDGELHVRRDIVREVVAEMIRRRI
jgi:hypothetical protein